MAPESLVGTWLLESYRSVLADGRYGEGPLGPLPRGLLIYGGDGHMAVSMMRSDGAGFMGYAGGWRVAGPRVVHSVAVSSHGYLVGTDQVREAALDGDLLILAGSAGPGGPPGRRELVWRRAVPAATS